MNKKLVNEARTLKYKLIYHAESGIISRPERLRRRRVADKARGRFTRRINAYYKPLLKGDE